MTIQEYCILPKGFLEQLSITWLEGLPELIQIVINEAMKMTHNGLLEAGWFETNYVLVFQQSRMWAGQEMDLLIFSRADYEPGLALADAAWFGEGD